MLKLAYPYQDKLNKMWQSVVFEDKYQYYNYGAHWDYDIKVDGSSWDRIQMVSVDSDDEVVGYFVATCDRAVNKISTIGAINFGDLNLMFSKDCYTFISNLFDKFRFRKIEWCIVVGNPAENMYDKFSELYGGKIVGIQRESTIISDGTVCDVKEYELLRQDYELHKKQRKKVRMMEAKKTRDQLLNEAFDNLTKGGNKFINEVATPMSKPSEVPAEEIDA